MKTKKVIDIDYQIPYSTTGENKLYLTDQQVKVMRLNTKINTSNKSIINEIINVFINNWENYDEYRKFFEKENLRIEKENKEKSNNGLICYYHAPILSEELFDYIRELKKITDLKKTNLINVVGVIDNDK